MNITIVGGGTAGWLAALMISKIQTSHTVTMIESDKIPIIGAGEGSTGHLRDIVCNNLWNFGCDQKEFYATTDATPKLGIKHKNWTPKKNTHYYGPIDGTTTPTEIPDYHFCHGLAKHPDKVHTITELGTYIEYQKSTFFAPESTTSNHAYHFDAHKVGQYFKKVCGEDVTTITTEVNEVVLDPFNGNITKLKLANGQELESDFFIDATGFGRVLMKKLDNEWISYAKHLPVNCALPFLLPYDDDEVIEPVTTALGMDAGWMWQIPTQQRWGMGYVFDKNHITPDQAHEEIERTLGKKVDPIRVLDFDSGRLKEPWKKNCLAIGLCAAFSEPLEATSIHATIIQLLFFVFEYLKDDPKAFCNNGNAYLYNRKINGMYDNFREFLEIHYAGGRTDTEFWKMMSSGETRSDLVANVIDACKMRMPNGTDFEQNYGYAGWSLWAFVLAGTGHLTPEIAQNELDFYDRNQMGKDIYDTYFEKWKNMSQSHITMTEFIRSRREINNTGG